MIHHFDTKGMYAYAHDHIVERARGWRTKNIHEFVETILVLGRLKRTKTLSPKTEFPNKFRDILQMVMPFSNASYLHIAESVLVIAKERREETEGLRKIVDPVLEDADALG